MTALAIGADVESRAHVAASPIGACGFTPNAPAPPIYTGQGTITVLPTWIRRKDRLAIASWEKMEPAVS